MAPPRKPTALKLLHGESRPSQLNLSEPRPREAEPSPPVWLSVDARRVWDRTVEELRHMRLLSAADTDSLAVYCQAVAHHAEAVELVERNGMLLVGRDGNLVKNPAMQFVRDQAVLVRMMGQQFGFTPSARAALSMGDAPDPEGGAERLLS